MRGAVRVGGVPPVIGPVLVRGVPPVRSASQARDRGAVTVELALALPAVVLVVAVLLVTAAATAVQLRCADGARAGARIAALGQSDAEVADVVRRIAGGASQVEVVRDRPWVEVRVSAAVPASWLTTDDLGLTARSTAWQEP